MGAAASPPRPLWIIAGGVYDLSTLDHPGPAWVIPAAAGTDCTDQFFSYHAMVALDVWRLLRRYRVPDDHPDAVATLAAVPPGQRCKFSWAEHAAGGEGELVVTDPLFLDLRRRLAPVLRGQPPEAGVVDADIDGKAVETAVPAKRGGATPAAVAATPPLLPRSAWKATPGQQALMAALFIAFLVSMRAWLAGSAASILPLAALYYWFNAVTLHDATHHSLFPSHALNSAAAAAFGGWHCMPAVWVRQHVEGHHGSTNTVDDPDMHHFDKKYWTPLGWRVRREQSYHPSWWVSLPAVLPMASLDPSYVRGAEVLLRGTYMGEKVVGAAGLAAPPISGGLPSATRLGLAAQLVFFFALAARQVAVHGWGWGGTLVVLPHALHGIHFYLITQVNHLTGPATAVEHGSAAYADANPANSWIAHQILSTVDWCPSSAAARVISGGLNAQVLHHLLPSVHPSRFDALQGVLEAFCADHRLPYAPFGSYWAAAAAHFRFLGVVNATSVGA